MAAGLEYHFSTINRTDTATIVTAKVYTIVDAAAQIPIRALVANRTLTLAANQTNAQIVAAGLDDLSAVNSGSLLGFLPGQFICNL
jgi:phage tail sheath gpL-like